MTSQTPGLPEFLAARLDEDERRAPMAGASAWRSGYGPERMLREVEAKRKILREHRLQGHQDCDTLRYLTEVYSDHPDYDEAWRP